MWIYEKKLQYPVNIKTPNAALAKLIITQFGGPDGELGASTRYLAQRYSMPYNEVVGALTDIGTEEIAHVEMICAIVYQLTRDLTPQQIAEQGFDAYFVDHTTGLYPVAASGVPFSASALQSKGDPITDLTEDLAAEGTITKEQPDITTPEKALFHAGSRDFGGLAQKRRLRPHKNNKSQKYDRTSCFRENKSSPMLLKSCFGQAMSGDLF